MADNNGGTDGGSNSGGVTPPKITEIGGRFKCTHEFVPSRYGQGYWKICVKDTLLGNEEQSTVYEAGQIESTARDLAAFLLTGNAANVAGKGEYRFDVPNQEDIAEGDTLDNPVENSLESGNGK